MSDNTTSWKDDKIKQLHAELDKAINELSGSITVNNLKDKEIERMKEAYNKYAWHKKDCMLFSIAEHPHCTCGFDKALAAKPQKGRDNE